MYPIVNFKNCLLQGTFYIIVVNIYCIGYNLFNIEKPSNMQVGCAVADVNLNKVFNFYDEVTLADTLRSFVSKKEN